MNTTGKILTAFAAGAAAGLIFGLLYAPEKGKDTRHKLDKKAKEFADNLKDKFRTGEEKFENLKENLKRSAEDLRAKAEEFEEKFSTLS